MTAAGAIVVRQRKSPGSQVRCSHGRQGSPAIAFDSGGLDGSRHGADRAGNVGP